jgi:hypothetical protein
LTLYKVLNLKIFAFQDYFELVIVGDQNPRDAMEAVFGDQATALKN